MLHFEQVYPPGMLILSRFVGQSFIVNEAVVYILKSASPTEAVLIRKTSLASDGKRIRLNSEALVKIGPGLRAVLMPYQGPEGVKLKLVGDTPQRIRRYDWFASEQKFPSHERSPGRLRGSDATRGKGQEVAGPGEQRRGLSSSTDHWRARRSEEQGHSGTGPDVGTDGPP